jgi:hypothetical protein
MTGTESTDRQKPNIKPRLPSLNQVRRDFSQHARKFKAMP